MNFSLNKRSKSSKKILVYRLGSLGDTIIVLPAFHLIRQKFPDHKITLLTNEPINSKAPAIESILEYTGLFDESMPYPSGERNIKKLFILAKKLISKQFDAVIYLAKPKGGIFNLLRDYLFFKMVSRKLIGIPFNKNNRNCIPLNPQKDMYEWDCLRALKCLKKLGSIDVNNDSAWNLHLTNLEIEQASSLLLPLNGKEFIVLSIGTKVSSKDWEHSNWLKLVERLRENYPQYSHVFIGAPDESERSDLLLSTGKAGLNLCGKTSPRVAAAILKKARLFIGHDSGPMHLAGCVGTKVVAIFSARNLPGQWYPRGGNIVNAIHFHKTSCYGCGLEDCIAEKKRCILSITVDEVFFSIEQLLSNSKADAIY